MTPLEKGQQILDAIADEADGRGIPLPSLRYVRVGAPVLACEAVIVGFVNTLPAPSELVPFDCGAVELATFIVTVGLDCSAAVNEDGSDNVGQMMAVSERAQDVGEVLWSFARDFDAFVSKEWNVTYGVLGGMSYITLQLTTGVD